jgi:hypothetical protein
MSVIPVRQSTAFECSIGPVLDADGVAVTDCVVADFKIKKTTGNFAALNASATLTHVSAGTYDLVLTTSDVDTVGLATVAIDDTVNACAPVHLQVLEEAVYDIWYAASATGLVPANVTQIGGDTQSATDLKDFADAGYDPATNKVQGVVLVDTTTTNTDMRGTDSAATATEMAKVPKSDSNVTWNATAAAQIQTEATDALNAYDPPTNAEMEARTLAAAAYATAAALTTVDEIVDDILVDTAEIGAAGAGLTNINLPNQTMDIVGNITGNLTGSVGSVTGGINTAAGVITTLDALDTAQDSQHGTTQTAVADVPTNAELATALDPLPTAAENAAAILAAGDVDGYSLEETLKLCLAALAGKLSGAATTTVTIRSADDSVNRIVATVDADGNRSAITLDETG